MKKALAILLLLLVILLPSACDDFDGDSDSSAASLEHGEFEMHFLDVGQADSTLIICQGEAMLVDGGNVADSSLVVAYLMDQGVSGLKYVINTHAHEDHVGGLSGVMAKFPVDEVFCPVDSYDSKAFRDFLKYTGEQGLTLKKPELGGSIKLGDAVITFIGPRSEYDDANNTSLVMVIDYGDTSFLISGDAERKSENEIMDAGCVIGVTVMKAGHHGSETSNSYRWIYEAEPQYAVISSGEDNSYGHPHEEVLSRFRDADVRVFRTDMQGHIVCYSDGEAVSFSVSRNGDAQTIPSGEPVMWYIGNKNSKVFHKDSCSGLPEEQNRVYFDERKDAVDGGYTSCGRCKP